jgi:hypothetical protein
MLKHFSTNTNSNWNQDDILKREARGPYGIVNFGLILGRTQYNILTSSFITLLISILFLILYFIEL